MSAAAAWSRPVLIPATYMKLSHKAVEWDDKLAHDAATRQEREKRERLTPFRLRHAELRKAKRESRTVLCTVS